MYINGELQFIITKTIFFSILNLNVFFFLSNFANFRDLCRISYNTKKTYYLKPKNLKRSNFKINMAQFHHDHDLTSMQLIINILIIVRFVITFKAY